MLQNLGNYRKRITEIVSPTFFKERKISEVVEQQPPIIINNRIKSLHLPEISLLLNNSIELDFTGCKTAQMNHTNKINVFQQYDQLNEGSLMKKSVILSMNCSPKNRKLQRRGTLFLIDENEQKKYEQWVNKLRKKTTDYFVNIILNHYIELFASIQMKHHKHLIDIYCEVGEQILQSPIILIRFTLVIGSYFLEIKDFNKSSFLSKQLFIITKMLSLYKERSRIMLFISKICQQGQQYEQSLQILEDGLVYSWLSDGSEEEAQIYESMGISLFYMQQQKKARIFHFKYVNGHLEPHNSQLRISIIQQLQLTEKLLKEKGEKQNEINEAVINRLQFPFLKRERNKIIKKIDISQFEENIKQIISELSQVIKYESILLRDSQIQKPMMKLRDLGTITSKYLEMKRKNIRLQWKQRERINTVTLDKNINEYITQRNKSIIDCQLLFKRIHDNIGYKKDKELEPILIHQTQKKPLILQIRKVFEQQLYD
ncbi:unnamed protein product [Paramecium sonneborni]|uniref:Uncharacterized protein n=1 Tax=Paramecium sonneborni TaxID=65129 RepID=A0A8S1REE6_9CILI|nr:unnamed protein product [Paramecium sonneborni]